MKKINENQVRGMVKQAIRQVLSESQSPRSFERRSVNNIPFSDIPFREESDIPSGEVPGTNVYAQVHDECAKAVQALEAAQRLQQEQMMGQDEDLQVLINDIYAYMEAIDPLIR